MIDKDISRAEWLECERVIARELHCRPWEFYCVMDPDEPAKDRDELAQQRWAALAAAACWQRTV